MSQTAEKIVAVTLGAHGHVTPMLGICRELVMREKKVVFFTTAQFADAVRDAGCEFRAYDSPFDRVMHRGPEARKTLRGPVILENVQHVLPELLPAVRAENPSAIVYDQVGVAGKCIAQILDVRAIAVIVMYAQNEHFQCRRVVLGRPPYPQKPPPAPAADFKQVARALSDTYGLPLFETELDSMAPEALNIACLVKPFQFAADTFDERFVFVGPTLPTDTAHVARERKPGESPRLLVSLGTVTNELPNFFRACMDAFAGSQWTVTMCLGSRVDVRQLEPIPSNIRLYSHLSHRDWLEELKQTDVCLMQGGMGSTMEALYYGVPLVVAPQPRAGDQAATAWRVREFGLGSILDSRVAPASSIRGFVESVYSDEALNQRVREMQHIVRAAGGANEAANRIIRHLRTVDA